MKTNRTAHFQLIFWVSSTDFWMAALMIVDLIGGVVVLTLHPAWDVMALATLLALTAAVSIIRQRHRYHLSRLRAAWDAYAERQISRQRSRE